VKAFAQLLPLVVIGGAFYLLFIRPAQRRQRAAAETVSALVPGVEVMTTAGLYATVVAVGDDNTVLLEVAPGVVSKYAKQAVSRVLTPEAALGDETQPSDVDPADDTEGGQSTV
jgi:preprotein translocase subunit YajC